MCGLVAIFSKKDRNVDRGVLQKMSDAIVHRGPDDEGIYCNEWLGLGFRRLAIIDLSALGHQPMFDKTNRYACIFNGEIYNYRELKKELQAQGISFRGNSDSEVLLNAYIHWGADCVNRFIGMFAFIIADLKEKSLFIARDFPGIKPLYVIEDSNFYYFASEIKAFAKVMPLSANPDCYYEHFNFRYLAGDRTHFNNVYKILPGHHWKLSLHGVKKHAYFDLAETFTRKRTDKYFIGIVADTQQTLHDSFMLHTRSDVGYCVQLSGGVDSSYLTSSIAAASTDPVHTFSITLDQQDYDESQFQQMVAKNFATQHHSIKMDARDYAAELKRATYYMDTPVVHSGCVFLMKLCHYIRDVSKVVLTGEGADELFGGYWRHKPTYMQNVIFQLQQHNYRGKWLPNISKFATFKKLLRENIILNSHRYQDSQDFQQFFTCNASINQQREFYANVVPDNYIDANLAYDQLTYITSVLDRQDKLSMSHSVEARVPYCHQKLYRYFNAIPSHYKIYNGMRKAVLKQCAAVHLPSALVYRRKNGLRLPLYDWYRDKNSVGHYVDLLVDNTAQQRGIYNTAFIKKALADFSAGNNRYAKAIIMLTNLELWHRTFNL